MLIPLSDDDRRLRGLSTVTTLLVVANVVVWSGFQGCGDNVPFLYAWSATPYELTTGIDLVGPQEVAVGGTLYGIPHEPGPSPIWITVLTAMFMHGSWAHLLGNLLYLWIFGDNVEHRFGRRVFLLFYLVSGVAATAAQVLLDPASMLPTLGASGAISGVLGAYMVLFPRNRVNALVFLWVVSVPAVLAIGAWVVFQFVEGWSTLSEPGSVDGGVAYGAHIGGFAAGVAVALLARPFLRDRRLPGVPDAGSIDGWPGDG